MKRRDFLKAAAGNVGALWLLRQAECQGKAAGYSREPAGTSKMNILFINNEDFTAEAIGCYGNDIVKTPRLDELAEQGVKFTRAYCNGVMCNASRASFLTGLRPMTTKVFTNGDPMNEKLPEYAVSLAEVLKERGALLANIGKLYHHTSTAEKQLRAFDRLEFCDLPAGYEGLSKGHKAPPCPQRRFRYSSDSVIERELIKRAGKSREMSRKYPPGHPQWWTMVRRDFQQLHAELVGDCGAPEECTRDGQVSRYAAQMLRDFAVSGEQFFLSVGFARPHTPLLAPKKYVDMYDASEIPMPEASADKDRNVPDCARRYGNEPDIFNAIFADEFPQLKETPERTREAIAAYYACASFIDAQVGLLLDALEETGLADNTIVIFFADHGFHLGEHGMWSKYTMFEQVTRVPFIIRVPGAQGNGRVCERIVELVDLLPTLCDLWDIKTPLSMEGTSFVPLLDRPERQWKKAAFITSILYSMNARSVRTKSFRYTQWQGSKGRATELYDLEKDPWEQNNLAGDTAYSGEQKRMSKLAERGWKEALPGKL